MLIDQNEAAASPGSDEATVMCGPNGPSHRATAILDVGGSRFCLVTTEI